MWVDLFFEYSTYLNLFQILFEQSMKNLNVSKGIYNMPLEKNSFECQKNSNMQTSKKKEFNTT
jgi:hypothetical protein